MTHSIRVRVYYEDTDLAGIVYYANYLKFIERGRTELLRTAGIDQTALKAETGVVFAVRRVEADYIAPARMDDLLDVVTEVVEAARARVVMVQRVRRGDDVLFMARVTLVCLKDSGRPTRIPAAIADRLTVS